SGAADGVPGAVRQPFAGAAGGARDAGLPRRCTAGWAHPAALVAQAHPGSAARDIAAAAPAAPAAQAARATTAPAGQAGGGEWSAGSAPGALVRRDHGVGADPLLSLRRAAASGPRPRRRAPRASAGATGARPAAAARRIPAAGAGPPPARLPLDRRAVHTMTLRARLPWHALIVPHKQLYCHRGPAHFAMLASPRTTRLAMLRRGWPLPERHPPPRLGRSRSSP